MDPSILGVVRLRDPGILSVTTDVVIPHRIHVWYIYLHLAKIMVDIPYMDPMGS